jgi:FMN phosphatase YigB (HAD superfamily)
VITALLFDLDNTLLDNDLGKFLPAYFERLAPYFADAVEPPQLVNAVIAATRAMLANTDPARLLLSIFHAHFDPVIGWDTATIQTRFDRFYRESYPALRSVTAPRPTARCVLEWAFASGYQVAIATSPLFPVAAIRERLRWAGLNDFPFTLISGIEKFHFAKPHPEYFAEILAYLGRRPDEVLVIGNDWADDILAAAALGLSQYWIAPPGSAIPESAPKTPAQPLGIGDLDMFLTYARATLPTLAPHPAPAMALPRLLTGNLAGLAGRLAELPAPAWTHRPTDNGSPAGAWSPTEIVCHLRDVDREVNLPRLHTVVETDNPFISGADTDPWVTERNYQAQAGPQALQEFIAVRTELYTYLARLPETAWTRPARHSLLGPSTLADLVNVILDHDRIHLDEVRVIRQQLGITK